jgi:uncharacterized protein YecE (DUF72 family)
VIVVATTGWSVPRTCATKFPGEGTHLERYARVMRGVEISTSFYREHARTTYMNWARQTPRSFRFAVKLPQSITHEGRLRASRRPLEAFLAGISGLGQRLGPLIVQLPPSLRFDARVGRSFFATLRERHQGPVVCEPRHSSWFEAPADALLVRHKVGRVAADPAIVADAARPGGWTGIAYFRLHGSPRRYWSIYDAQRLSGWADDLKTLPRRTPTWCVFDNTASGGAAVNAVQLLDQLD